MQIPAEIRELCLDLREGLLEILKDKLFGLYIYGAAAFPDGSPIGDVDFHVFLFKKLAEYERRKILSLHKRLEANHAPMGNELDGYYLLVEDARRSDPPQHQIWSDIYDNCWALHRAHMLAGRVIVLYGPEPGMLLPTPSWDELESDLYGELKYVEDHFKYPDYCILNLCRIMYSFENRDVVVSKFAAANWMYKHYPQWQRQIEISKRSYTGQGTRAERHYMLTEVAVFFQFVSEHIRRIYP